MTHAHYDHYDKEIFTLVENAHYLLSDDIKVQESDKIKVCGAHEKLSYNGIDVETFGSTDEGLSYLITLDGRTVFHAGDLNWWHWAEEDLAWNRNMEVNFKRYTEPLRGRHVDLAMLPLDSRLKTGGYLGPNYFLNLMEVRRFLPMHQWEDFAFTDEFLSAYPQFAPITVKIHRDGEFLGEL